MLCYITIQRMMNKYFLHEKLGDGGYSSVHRCSDTVGIRYICKVLPKDKNKRVRVQNEVQILRKLAFSTKVPRIVDALEDDQAFYIVQEWCRGGPVQEYVSVYDKYSENTVASIIRGVLRGLHHIHEAGVIHRDIKASNILLADKSEDAEVKICDFGSAVMCDFDSVETTDLNGTPWFMAPEALSHTVSPKSDIWSMGVMTYQLLTGRMPFNDRNNPRNPSVSLIWRSILNDEPSWDAKYWAKVSPEAKDFVKLCLQKPVDARPTVKECLAHPWLSTTECTDRFKGKPLSVKPFVFEDASMMNAHTYRLDM